MTTIFTVEIQYEQDVVQARQRTREIAEQLGFAAQDQARLATAVSEIARNAFQYARGGTVEFSVDGEPQAFVIRIQDQGQGIPHLADVLAGCYTSSTGMGLGIMGSRKLMEFFEIESLPGRGTTVVMSKKLSKRTSNFTDSQLQQIRETVIKRSPQNPYQEIQRQNQELLRAMAELRKREEELTAATDGFDFLGWHISVQSNGKFRCTPSVENFKKFRQKVKAIVNCSNYGSEVKALKLAPIVRGWRNYHRFCDMKGTRFSLWFPSLRAFRVFNKETKNNRESSIKLVQKAFPTVPYSQNAHVMVKGNKTPFDGDLTYWSQRNSKLYDGSTSKALQKQNHTCGHCGLKMTSEERVHLHHIDGNHDNWKTNNLQALHESCHDYVHMGKSAS